MSAANGTQRDIGLDLTRILAFLAVPSVHFFLNSTYYDTAIVGPRMALMTVMRTAFMVCVPLYMLLSGYLSAGKHIPLTRPGLLGYYKKLLPIFLTYALSTGVILLYRVLWLGEEQTIRSAVKNLLSFQQYSWYMNMYFGLLLLTPFLNALWQSLATPAARRALLAVLLVLTVLPGMVNIYHLHSAETLLHPWLSTSYDQLVPDWWQRLYPITYYFLGGYLRAHVDIKRLRTGRLAALLLLAVLCFGGYNVWRNQGIPFVWGSWCDWGSLQNVVDTVLVFLLLNSIRYSTPPTSITRFTGYLSKLTLGAYLVSWIPDNYLYTMLKSAVPSVTDQLNYFPLTVGGTILISLLLAAVVECCVSLLMRLLRRSAKAGTAGTAQA